jgi:multidrug efflux pump subunit AcrA (membrane-fusion protein)
MRKIDRRIVIVVSVIFILGLAYGLMRFLIAQKEEPPVRQTIESRRYVRVEPVKYSSISSSVSRPGRLSSIAEVDIIAEASGKIEAGNVSLKKGASFSKGDVLFVVYPDEAILSLKARKSQYQNTLASIIPDLVIDFPESEEAFSQFFYSIDVAKPLPPMPEIEDNKMKIFLASRNVISEYYSIESDELQLNRRTVRAPFNGTFKDVYMELGAYTNAGGRVARAIRTDQLELEVAVQRADAIWIKQGDPVTVTSESSRSWQGKVIRKSQFVDENTQSQTIFINIPYDHQQPLLAGEYLVAHFPVKAIEGVMEIPRNAVFNSNEVFIARSGRLAKEKINVIKLNTSTLIFNGLPEGDSVVVQQLINVSEGTLVQVDKEAAQQMGPGGPGGAPKGPPGGQAGSEENKKEQSAQKSKNK